MYSAKILNTNHRKITLKNMNKYQLHLLPYKKNRTKSFKKLSVFLLQCWTLKPESHTDRQVLVTELLPHSFCFVSILRPNPTQSSKLSWTPSGAQAGLGSQSSCFSFPEGLRPQAFVSGPAECVLEKLHLKGTVSPVVVLLLRTQEPKFDPWKRLKSTASC